MRRFNMFPIYWMQDDNWSYYDEEKQQYVITENAPQAARDSFEEWKKINHYE